MMRADNRIHDPEPVLNGSKCPSGIFPSSIFISLVSEGDDEDREREAGRGKRGLGVCFLVFRSRFLFFSFSFFSFFLSGFFGRRLAFAFDVFCFVLGGHRRGRRHVAGHSSLGGGS